jgi:pimeloyl-ACP methyl ester carboxylesterase
VSILPPLLLLPGMLCDAALWQGQQTDLSAQGSVAITPLTGAETIHALALMLLRQYEGKIALAGHSMGGYVALAMQRLAPERIVGLALINSAANPALAEERRRRQHLVTHVETHAQQGMFRGVTRRLYQDLVDPQQWNNELLAQIVMTMAKRQGIEAYRRQQNAIMHRPDARPALAAITCPVTIIAGQSDKLTPPSRGEEMAQAIKGAKFFSLANVGHLAPLEVPTMVTNLLQEWWQSL